MSNLATIVNNILADSGIDDINVVVTTGSYSNPAFITALAWTKITGTPTTLGGYGITDAYTQTQVNNLLAAKQNNITLTTTGTSGAATLVGATLNIPDYGGALGAYLPLAGGTMTGNINWAQTDRGIVWSFNTDGASIKFYNTGDGDTDSRLEFATLDNNDEYFRWGHIPSGGSFYESMRLRPVSNGNAELIVTGKIIKSGGTSSQYLMADGSVSTLTNPVTGTGTTNFLPKFTGASTIGNSLVFDNGGNIGIGTINASVKLQIVDASTPRFYLGTSDSKFGGLVYTEVGSFGSLAIRGQGNDIGTVIHIDRGNSEIRFTTNETPRLTLNSAGNLGLGVTPSAGGLSGYVLFELGNGGASIYSGPNQNLSGANISWSGGTASYKISNFATLYNQQSGQHQWYNAPSGTAGNAISFTQAMTLTSGGNLLVGTTTDNGARLQVSGTAGNASPFVTFSTTSANSTFNWVSTAFASNLAAGNNLIHFIGQTGSTKNSAYLGFKYQSSGSNDNILTLGLFGVDNVLNINGLGNVGIGTQSPNQALMVNGRIRVSPDGINGGDMAVDAGGLAFCSIQNTAPITFQRNNFSAESMRIFSDGNVGINTGATNAGFRLDVNGGSAFRDTLRLLASGVNAVNLSWTGSNTGLVNLFHAGSLTTQILASGNSYFNGGNVGIGTATPGQKLTVNGNVLLNASDSKLYFSQINSIERSAIIQTELGGENNHSLLFFTNPSFGLPTERMRITSAGNVGIGTATPSTKFVVSNAGAEGIEMQGNGSVSGGAFLQTYNRSTNAFFDFDIVANNMIFRTGQSYSERMRITSGGSVSIGTLSNRGSVNIIAANSGSNVTGLDITNAVDASFNVSLRTNFTTITAGGAGNLVFANAAERLRITSNGTIGINGSSDVGDAGLSKMSMGYLDGSYGWLQTWSGRPILINPFGNNVLIGTTSNEFTGARLQVVSGGQQVIVASHSAVSADFNDALFLLNTNLGQRVQIGLSTNDTDGQHHRAGLRAYKGAGNLEGVFGIVLRQTNGQYIERLTINAAGNLSVQGSMTATSFFESSDSRIKTLLKDKLDYSAISNVTTKYYEKNGKIELGYFAQDFETLLPSAVSKNEDGLLNLSYREVHTAKIAYLEEKIKQLEKRYENN